MSVLINRKIKYAALIMCALVVLAALGGFSAKCMPGYSSTQFFAVHFSPCFKNANSYALSGIAPPHFEAWISEEAAAPKTGSGSLLCAVALYGILISAIILICKYSKEGLNDNLTKDIFHLRI